jgi:BirA family biotin operon repressor/biotin-[acetyl-CoA-carboxylase] ligase
MTIHPLDQTWTLDSTHVGRTVFVYDRIDSTNSRALEQSAQPKMHGQIFLAQSQSAGRGQYGRTWQAPLGSSVLMSVLLFPPAALRRPALLTAWAAVSVCETILRLTSVQATIKWPNDVLVLGKKICGILIEQRTTGNPEFPLATVAGIGLNITQTAAMFEQADLPFATSLWIATGQTLTFDEVAKALIHQLDSSYDLLVRGDCTILESLWKRRLGLMGKSVLVECAQQTIVGRLLDVTLAGLDVESDNGEIVRVQPESVRHLREK